MHVTLLGFHKKEHENKYVNSSIDVMYNSSAGENQYCSTTSLHGSVVEHCPAIL